MFSLNDYLEECNEKLGEDWIKSADSVRIDGVRTVGSIAKDYAIQSYINGTGVTECVHNIKYAFPEIE